MTPQTLEQRVTHLEAELKRLSRLLPSEERLSIDFQPDEEIDELPLGIFKDDPYFDEILQRMREERELEADNPAYT
jgi:hypothetical protein